VRGVVGKEACMRKSLPMVELLYKNEHGTIAQKHMPWKRPVGDKAATDAALEDWIIDYYGRVYDEGYLPVGFTEAPKPVTARVWLHGKVRAEWQKRVTV